MTPEQQKAIAMARARQRMAQAQQQTPEAESKQDFGTLDAFGRAVADIPSFGFADEVGAGARWLGGKVLPWRSEVTWDEALNEVRGDNKTAEQQHPIASGAGTVVGALGLGSGLARAGLSATANAVKAGKGLGGISKASAVEGAVMGGAHGFGSGEGFEGRFGGAASGAAVGGVIGGAVPSVVAGAAGAVKAAAAPVLAPLRPTYYAEKAMAAYLKNSGKTPEEIATIIQRAVGDGQDMFSVADAMGNAGQRALVPVTRTPNKARQEVTDWLTTRQMGQSERLSQTLADGFDATDTAAQRFASLKSARDAAAGADYGSLRAKMGDTPIWNSELQSLTSRPSVRSAIGGAAETAAERGYKVSNPFTKADDGTLSLPEGTAPNFTFWDTVKRGLDDQINSDPTNGAMIGTKNTLLEMLERHVPGYAKARAPFAAASRAMDAVDTGKAAASPRMRAGDTIPRFNGMSEAEQKAFRAGYADPYIARIESASLSPTTNKARPLMTEKTGMEFPAFAAPGKADQMGNRIAREQRMFETANAALGGSKTADNLADIDDMANFDPAIMTNLLSGNWKQAALSSARSALNAGKGMPPRVVERTGRALMETNPARALDLLKKAQGNQTTQEKVRAMILASVLQGTSAGAGRLP